MDFNENPQMLACASFLIVRSVFIQPMDDSPNPYQSPQSERHYIPLWRRVLNGWRRGSATFRSELNRYGISLLGGLMTLGCALPVALVFFGLLLLSVIGGLIEVVAP